MTSDEFFLYFIVSNLFVGQWKTIKLLEVEYLLFNSSLIGWKAYRGDQIHRKNSPT